MLCTLLIGRWFFVNLTESNILTLIPCWSPADSDVGKCMPEIYFPKDITFINKSRIFMKMKIFEFQTQEELYSLHILPDKNAFLPFIEKFVFRLLRLIDM